FLPAKISGAGPFTDQPASCITIELCLSDKCRGYSSVDIQNISGRFIKHTACKSKAGRSDIFRQNYFVKQSSLRVVGWEFFNSDSVSFCTTFGPTSGPDIT